MPINTGKTDPTLQITAVAHYRDQCIPMSFKSVVNGGGEIDVAAEVGQLRMQYDLLCKKKRVQEIRKLRNITPTKTQMRLYEEGRRKILTERSRTGRDTRDNSSTRRGASPIPVCNRLYKDGMNKLQAEKMTERKMEELKAQRQRSTLRDPPPIPVCDRLYEEGMHKVMSGKTAQAEAEFRPRRRYSSASPMPICDRLYEQGMTKKKERKNNIASNRSCDSTKGSSDYSTSKTRASSGTDSTANSSEGFMGTEITMSSPRTRNPSPLPLS